MVTQFGDGKPSALFVAGIHGDEKTGPLILKLLSKEIKPQQMKGTLHIISIANPDALQANQRLHPDDRKDLNRSFTPSRKNSPTNNMAKTITRLAIKQQLIVDIHVFPHQISPIVGVSLLASNIQVQKKSNRLLHILKPDVIWVLNTKNTEPNKGGSLCELALRKNILAFALELPPHNLISQKQIKRLILSLKRVLRVINIIDGPKLKISKNIPSTYERQIFRSAEEGFFTPKKKILTPIKKNDGVGMITYRQTGETKKILSPFTGTLLTISEPRQIKIKEKLFVVGKKYKSHYYF